MQSTVNFPQLHKLLLNAWSAEFGLRCGISPVDPEPGKNLYVLSQAYYAVYFLCKAFLILLFNVKNFTEKAIGEDIVTIAKTKSYYPQTPAFQTRRGVTFYERLKRLQINSKDRYLFSRYARIFKLSAIHQKLIAEVSEIMLFHEGQIMDEIGVEAYRAILADLPDYMKVVVYERFMSLLERKAALYHEAARITITAFNSNGDSSTMHYDYTGL